MRGLVPSLLTVLARMLAPPVASPAEATPTETVVVLPGASSAEGIAAGRGSTFYAGDFSRGDIFRALCGVDQPRSTLHWLQRSGGPAILRQMARGEIPISHEGLDQLPRTKVIDHLRDLLTAVGVLPNRVVLARNPSSAT